MPRWRLLINRVGAAVLCVLLLLVLAAAGWRAFGVTVDASLPNFAHAGGAIDGQTYINGLDAFEQSYAKGYRVFEVDFSQTSDGSFVCSHDWKALGGKAPDLKGFLAWRGKLKYPPCTLDELVGWFKQHPDTKLVSDAKIDILPVNTALEAALPTQLIPEVYNSADLAAIDRRGLKPILALYKLSGVPSRLMNLQRAGGQPLTAVGMSPLDVWLGLALWAKLWNHVPVYVYTINNCNLVPSLRLMGADGIFTDTLGVRPCP